MERAHEKQPHLFTVENPDIYSASKKCTEEAIDRIGNILQEWQDRYGAIPFTEKDSVIPEPGAAKLPFWNAPLLYPERDNNGGLNLKSLTEHQRRQFLFASKIRDIAVELLRAEQWIY